MHVGGITAEDYWGNVNSIGPRSCYDEGKRCAAPRDEVDLARGNAEPLPKNVPAVQAQPPGGAPFGPAAPRFGGGAVQARSFNASARA